MAVKILERFGVVTYSTFVHRGALGTREVVVFMALGMSAVLHCAQLHFTSLGALVHGYVCGLHTLDCHLLLPHGVDGKFIPVNAHDKTTH